MNKTVKFAVCDDEMTSAAILEKRIIEIFDDFGFNTESLLFESGESLLASEESFDLIFADCRLPGMSGIETAVEFGKNNKNCTIILISAYPEYAVEGYCSSAIRFLVKPIKQNKLHEAINAFIQDKNNECVVSFTSDQQEITLRSTDILYIESLGRKTVVRSTEGSFETYMSLNTFEKAITDSNFFRTSRQFMINVSKISSRKDNKLFVDNMEVAFVSFRKLAAFNKFYNNYLLYH